jgi:hypothetical protein
MAREGAISPRLTQRMLNELGEDADQLPVLQHALLRTSDAWTQNRKFDQPINFDDYESICGFELAWSRHADATLTEVSKQVPGAETAVKLNSSACGIEMPMAARHRSGPSRSWPNS